MFFRNRLPTTMFDVESATSTYIFFEKDWQLVNCLVKLNNYVWNNLRGSINLEFSIDAKLVYTYIPMIKCILTMTNVLALYTVT